MTKDDRFKSFVILTYGMFCYVVGLLTAYLIYLVHQGLKMDKCREEFECWYKNFSGCDVINFDEFGFTFAGQYKCASNWLQNTTLLASWQAW